MSTGYSEYIHQCGYTPLSLIIQQHLQDRYLKLISLPDQYYKIYPNCDDYLRKDPSNYDQCLLNSDWKILSYITLVEGIGSLIIICARHNSRCNQENLHLPRQPHNILISDKGNQLCHAVIKTRTVKPMKINKYSNKFQIHKQEGLFQGIDIYDVTSIGSFAYYSVLLDESESRTIACKPDINKLLEKFHREKTLTADSATAAISMMV